jgi:uncharacterized protein (TIGR00730 family)
MSVKFERQEMKTEKFNSRKAYENLEFLNSPAARSLRILAEFLEPMNKFNREGIKDTIVFFGSARVLPGSVSRKNLKDLMMISNKKGKKPPNLHQLIQEAKNDLHMSRFYEDAVQLSRMITEWTRTLAQPYRFVICSGGGPGIMEAANKGAALAKGRSVGLNISLPFEQTANPYVSDELNMEFHYFFMRKFWFAYLGKAFVMFPGGFGTFDELMEILTLLQTKKLKKKITIILYGREYWNEIIDFKSMVRLRVIGPEDLNLFHLVDSPKEAFDYLVTNLRANYPLETA